MENQKVTRQAMEKLGVPRREVKKIYVTRSLIFTVTSACVGVGIGLLSAASFSALLENMLSISGVEYYAYPAVTFVVALGSVMFFCLAAFLGVHKGVKNNRVREKH